MTALEETVREFLASERIAVAGVSRDSRQPANAIYRKLRASGRRVAATNPRTERAEGDPCYPSLCAIPGSVAPDAVAFCREHGITVIPGACPMMYLAPVDIPHRCVRTVLGWFGRLPHVERVSAGPDWESQP
jgi:uncharacterized protein